MSQKKIKEARRLEREEFQQGGEGSYASLWISLVVAVLVLWGGWYYLYGGTNNNTNMNNETQHTQQDAQESEVTKEDSTLPATTTETSDQETPKKETKADEVSNERQRVVIETSKGNIVVELRAGKAPKTVQNFLDLVGKSFYDGLTFHRVEPGFVIQGGDPQGNGTGGSGTNILLEIMCEDGTLEEGKTVTCPVALPHTDGALAMARSGDPNSASSQFYITNGEQKFLNGNYAVFGYVVEGLEFVRDIQVGDTMDKVYVQQ